MRRVWFLLPLLAIACAGIPRADRASWDSVGEQLVFFGDQPVDFHLRVDMEALEKTLKKRHYITGDLIYKGRKWGEVGIRYRGGVFSRGRPKRAFKIKFTTIKGRRFYGLKRLNFNMERNDPSFVREKIVCEMLRGMGVPTPRIGYARLYINGKFRGLYLNVEQIDDLFVKNHIKKFDGILYKAGWPACFRLKPKTGVPEVGVFPVKELSPELKRKEKAIQKLRRKLLVARKDKDSEQVRGLGKQIRSLRAQYLSERVRPLDRFIRLLNTSKRGEIASHLSARFDVDTFLKVLAVHNLVAAWDNYYMTPGNFYLYWDRNKDRFHWIAYDYDNTLGIDFFGINWATSSLLDFAPRTNGPEVRPLIDRLLAIPVLRKQYIDHVARLLKGPFRYQVIEKRARRLQALIGPTIKREMRLKDNYSKASGGYKRFTDNIDADIRSSHRQVKGMLPFVKARIHSVKQQLVDIRAGRMPGRPFRNTSRAAALGPGVISRDRVFPGGEHWFRIGFSGQRVGLLFRGRSRLLRIELYSGGRLLRTLPAPNFQRIYHLQKQAGVRYVKVVTTAPFSVPIELIALPLPKSASGRRFLLSEAVDQLIGKGREGVPYDKRIKAVRVVALRRKGREWDSKSLVMKKDGKGFYSAVLPLPVGRWAYHFSIPGFGDLPDPAFTTMQWGRFSVREIEKHTN